MAEHRPPPRTGMKRLTVRYVNHGKSEQVEVDVPDVDEPGADAQGEAGAFVQMLADTRQLDGESATHEVVAEADGTRWLRRTRFKAR